MAILNFNANNVDPASSFDPLPAGKYLAAITASEMKPTKSGSGHFLELTFALLDGPYKGRQLWGRLNLDNPNPQAVKIAEGELAAICRAVGVMNLVDSAQLHNLPLCIKVTCKARPDTGEIGNEVRGYEKKEAAFSGSPAGPGVVTPPTPQATAQTPIWKR